MKDGDSIFGASPEGLDRLVSRVLENVEPEHEALPTMSLETWSERPGGQIGCYKLLDVLGEGGMGVVYRAEQDRPIKRQVALKVIKPGMDTKQVIARFEAERQALALLDHPNIARVYNAGTTEAGRSYFVMELVAGVPITEHCDKHKLSIEERLGLFVQVCDAIQHAHQKGIIHRDIKPSNILVSIRDGQAIPKIIDFGIAKAMTQSLTDRTLYTEQGQFVGTPEYMSPEQADLTAQGIDTRSDIYSLGVVLYELLTGVLPFDPKSLRQGGAERIRKIICEEDPKTPSTRLSTASGEESTKLANLRRTDARTLGRRLHGDLDWITLKAMEKDPNRRYETPHALADDILRHLNDEPVTAGSPSVAYRLQKYVRRNRVKVAAALCLMFVAAIIIVSLGILRQGLRESRTAETIRHQKILADAVRLGDEGKYQDAMAAAEPIMTSKYLGAKARLLHARLLALSLQSSSEAVVANDLRWSQIINELKGLLGESDEIAGQAHFLLAIIYYESDPDAPTSTRDYVAQWEYHQQEAEKLLGQTADSHLLRAISAATVSETLRHLDMALELDSRHFESLKVRVAIHRANSDYRQMALDAAQMKVVKPRNPLGYSLSAIAQRGLGWFEEALADHDKAIQLSPEDADLVEQRYQTHMQRGDYQQALLDGRECVRLEPSVNRHLRHVFFAQVALGQYEEAARVYEDISATYDFNKEEFDDWATGHVYNTLDSGLVWHPAGSSPTGKAFLPLLLADASYQHLTDGAERLISMGNHPSFAPDGESFAYALGTPRSTGIAVYDLRIRRSRLLAVPGKEPAWSPDGRYIAYTRDRRTLPFSVLSEQQPVKGWVEAERVSLHEIWVMRIDGSEPPRFMAKGHIPSWSRDSKRLYYHSYADGMLYAKPIDDPNAEPTLVISRPWQKVAISPHDDRSAHSEAGELHIANLENPNEITRIPDLPGATLSWSPDDRSLLAGSSGPLGQTWFGALWFCDLNSMSAIRLFRAFSVGHSVFSPDPEQARLLLTVSNLKIVWGNEIWMAELSPEDCRRRKVGACQNLTEHLRDVVQSYYSPSIEMDPNEPMNYLVRAQRYLTMKDLEKALMDMEHFARIEQDLDLRANPYLNQRLNYIVIRKATLNWTVDRLIQALGESISPDSPGRNGLAWCHFYAGLWAERELDYQKAIDSYRTATRIYPEHAVAFNRLACIQATCPVNQWHSDAALKNATTACDLTEWSNANFVETYAAAQANAGDFTAAVRWQKEALKRYTLHGNEGLKARALAKLDLYEQQKTYYQQYLWPNKLIAWWKFDRSDTQQVRDHSGNNLHGRFRDDACIVSDPDRGEVLSLDGEGDFVDCGRDVRFDLTETISICAWIKTRVLNKLHQSIISNGDRGWIFNRQAYTNRVQIVGYGLYRGDAPAGLWGDLGTQTEVTDGRWHHLVGVYDGTHLLMYVDGKIDAKVEATGRIRCNDWPVFIGENSEKTAREWDGLIDDIRIYSYALGEDDVTAIYAGGDARPPH